jgi:hypothetical protein
MNRTAQKRTVFKGMNDLLLSLRVVSKIQANERLGQRVDGILTIEPSNRLLCRLHRYLRGDSRAQSMRELDRIIRHAHEKASDLMNSRFLDDGKYAHAICTQLSMLKDNLLEAMSGMRALQQTYSDDANVVACIDQLISRTQEIANDIGTV